MLSEWLAWREKEADMLKEERRELGLKEDPDEEEKPVDGDSKAGTVVEEIVEEVLDETEELA